MLLRIAEDAMYHQCKGDWLCSPRPFKSQRIRNSDFEFHPRSVPGRPGTHQCTAVRSCGQGKLLLLCTVLLPPPKSYELFTRSTAGGTRACPGCPGKDVCTRVSMDVCTRVAMGRSDQVVEVMEQWGWLQGLCSKIQENLPFSCHRAPPLRRVGGWGSEIGGALISKDGSNRVARVRTLHHPSKISGRTRPIPTMLREGLCCYRGVVRAFLVLLKRRSGLSILSRKNTNEESPEGPVRGPAVEQQAARKWQGSSTRLLGNRLLNEFL